MSTITGKNCNLSESAVVGKDVKIGHNCVIEDDVVIGNEVYLGDNTIIRSGTKLGDRSFIGANCIIGEYQMDYIADRSYHKHALEIGSDAVIRSNTIIYSGSQIGNHFQTGHHATVRENAKIGNSVSLGTLSDVQGHCEIGDYVRAHSNVHIGQMTRIDSFVWIFPYVVFTNDPTPPSDYEIGVHVCSFATVATRAVILPGRVIGQDSLVAAGSVVTKDVQQYEVVAGNPGRKIADVRDIKNKITGEPAYPWRNHFKRAMPWAESDFKRWYASLDIAEIQAFHLEEIDMK